MSKVRVILKKSLNGVSKNQKQTASCLGLKKINQSRCFKDNPAFRGQVKKIQHLLSVEKL